MSDKITAIADLLVLAGKAHHQAYIETDGDDPEWPIWYASYLQKPLNSTLNTDLTKSQIVFELVRLNQLYGSSSNWAKEYADDLSSKYLRED